MSTNKELKNKLKTLISEYESNDNLGEYAKGRLSAFKMILEDLKNQKYQVFIEMLIHK
jgi:hypothetical protein